MSTYDKSGNLVANIGQGHGLTPRPYWVFHLDCARKYFSVANIKTMIDAMQENGLNQFQMHFSEDRGFRFELNDMIVVTTDGDEYDLSDCVSTDLGGALSESDMDEIIMYAREKNIDVVPSLDMPGHMSKILTEFPQFKYYKNSAWTLDATNTTAVKFALAIVEKYATYFSSRGCKYWNIGADEVGYSAYGRWKYLESADIPTFVEFVNTVARLITSMGMIPRAFNDGIIYNADYANLFDKNIQIYNWCNATIMAETGIQDVDVLVKNNYSLINTNYSWYFIVPTDNSMTRKQAIEANTLLKAFKNGTTAHDQSGACICVWCDSDTTADGGDAALNGILAYIDSFGIGIQATLNQLDYPIIT